MLNHGIQGAAKFSDCGTYRYTLERSNLGGTRTALVCMVNPSKAGAVVSDMTVTKLIGFSVPLDLARFIAVNAAALVSTDPAELSEAADPIGPDNDQHIALALAEVDDVIVAWGASIDLLARRFPGRRRQVLGLLRSRGHKLMCWGTTAGGHPRHPSRIPYSTQLVRFEA
jgi:hypothetical protein